MAVTGNALDLKLTRRVFNYAKPYRGIFYWAVILTIALAIVAPLRPYLVEYTVDHYILFNDMNGLLKMTGIMIGLLLLQTVIQYNHTFCTNWLGQSVIKDIRKDIFDHITNLRLKYFDNTPIGTLITRTVSDLETIADVFSEGIISIVGDILQIVTIIAFMLYTDVKLTLVVLAPMPLLIMATYIFKEAIKSAFQEVRQQVTRLNTFLQEHITGMSVTQLFSREDQEFNKFKQINRAHRRAHIRSNWYYSIFFPVVELISAMSIGLLVWWGSREIIGDKISPGVVVSFIMYINMLYRPIRELADKFNTLQMGMVSAERVFKVIDTDEITPNNGTLQPAVIKGDVEFNNVWFAYNDEQWVLKDISFKIKPGETLALVGATGAGKSSTINILNRFYEIGKGSVKLDGVDIRAYDLHYLRSCIATVLQDVFLFSDTIYNNISLNNSKITKEEIEEAAREVGAEEFIKRLPGGFEYNVMERGATLSVGQAQLISFIRALVYNPKILVLDEATSSVDTETEELIQNAILKLMQGRTTIVIAHRLSTIQNADKIIVLDKGEIKEMGNHQELLRLNGYYKRLYDLQFNSAGIKV
ncbi:ABC transporter ATP-binding protein [Solitalea canadensis]|uniref:ABC-type multidrug transport system, ATPase and permease component n=1 Tax=Solitalea canadensis (strain ATCC 29591 / DSM 3403 / JCM 21819 / LMG 8368 / NBRC 15130 / NCIMB 12057 / USAM 9D) TaxID=929556 RepID=H8KSW3_SOLCM|nr:ABC transporter ATP-binding protein [Solitalea canadensis]AFD05423.1 ABC-type multidrug transport system, ATPase and permease component [Solitalea canadensis DSM 3403]